MATWVTILPQNNVHKQNQKQYYCCIAMFREGISRTWNMARRKQVGQQEGGTYTSKDLVWT